MRHHARARGCALVAALALALALAAAPASASEALGLSSQSFRVAWSALSFEGAFGTVTCALTIEGSFHSRSIFKAPGNLVGYVSRATAGTCSRGSMTVLAEALPWHVQYASFAGTLPNITTVNVSTIGASVSVREPIFGITCLFRSSAERPATLALSREASGALTTAGAGGSLPESGCGLGVSARLSGSGTVSVQGSTTRITVSLVELADVLTATPGRVTFRAERTSESIVLKNTHPTKEVNINGIEVWGNFEYRNEERCMRSIRPDRECTIRVETKTGVRSGDTGEVRVNYSPQIAPQRTTRITLEYR